MRERESVSEMSTDLTLPWLLGLDLDDRLYCVST